MPTESRGAFLLVRDEACLVRANEDLRVYQSFLRHRLPFGLSDIVLGIWVNDEDVVNLPGALVLPDVTGAHQVVRIQEAAGINGLWMWCWLEAGAPTVTRLDLVDALLACFARHDAEMHRARFIPVFAADATDAGVHAEWQTLAARYPGLVQPPIRQDASGGLMLDAARTAPQGRVS